MSIFDDNNIAKELPIEQVYRYIKDVVDNHFRKILKDTNWDTHRSEEIFNNEFERKFEFFKAYGFAPAKAIITSYSLSHWHISIKAVADDPVIYYVSNEYYQRAIEKKGEEADNIEIYSQYIDRHWEDVNDMDCSITTFIDNL